MKSSGDGNPVKLTFVGGGSYAWAPTIIRDIMMKKGLPSIEFWLLDPDADSAGDIRRLAERMNKELQGGHTFRATDVEEEAFAGTDFVIICISTGGLDMMAHDLAIPEKYGIYQTVGDTVGPGGWSRNLRNIPVFNRLARTIESASPHAVVLNYTNPMACLTKAFYAQTRLRTVGLCHGLFENLDILQRMFGLEREDQLKVRFAGVNHFFWMLDFTVNGANGYALLHDKLRGGKRLADLIGDIPKDGAGFHSQKQFASELFEVYGYLPYFGDRHTCEFFPHVMADEQRLQAYDIARTTIGERRERREQMKRDVLAAIDGVTEVDYTPSRETAADIIEAICLNRDFIDVMNIPNVGQIPNLPLGGIVETLGVANSLGFTPMAAGPLPDPLLRLVRPHLENSETIYRAATEGDRDLALLALYNDPACAHLSHRDIRNMANELFDANRAYLV